ncbi:hypothetical protein LL033_05290 [Clostridium estertheticum]|uniref:hypothetical protein n=1 Tax=Clostridium estertheticum TaxID=238834 RepID=UPI001C0CDBF0|nr:hypothetical protein [Clostridium estertheticum]MBU3217480.1 hypothetical protein [Clostridium estertheticum]WAG56659.1 hypothetical protein LL033_05290 [Clostridium estertheticum]
MNRKVKISIEKNKLLIIALIIILVFGSYTFFTQKQKKQSTNEAFINCLNEADACFAVPYSKFDEEDKVYYYMKASANLHTAMYILPFTSYANVENKSSNSANALSRLYMCITLHCTPQSNNRLIAFNKKEQEIYMYLHYISVNPNDKKNWDSLSKIAEDIGY